LPLRSLHKVPVLPALALGAQPRKPPSSPEWAATAMVGSPGLMPLPLLMPDKPQANQ